MLVRVKAKIITCRVYEKKDNSGKGITDLSLLVDETLDYALSGKIIKPYMSCDSYRGIYDFSGINRFDEVEVELDMGVFDGKESYKLFDLQRLDKKK